MSTNPLKNRLGFSDNKTKLISGDFPITGRVALGYAIKQLINKGQVTSEDDVVLELKRVGRFTKPALDGAARDEYRSYITSLLVKLEWYQVFYFCERLYAKYLKEMEYFDGTVSTLEDAQNALSEEINLILEEENLAFQFEQGLFFRRGRAQTQQAIERVGTVLSAPMLDSVRKLYNKAKSSFDKRPDPDVENCVKDAVCALEVCLEILTGKKTGNDFAETIRRIEGNGSKQIPPPIGNSIIKIHSYRGSGTNVAHGTNSGNKVTILEAELILSLIATYITYLVDLLPLEDEIPF